MVDLFIPYFKPQLHRPPAENLFKLINKTKTNQKKMAISGVLDAQRTYRPPVVFSSLYFNSLYFIHSPSTLLFFGFLLLLAAGFLLLLFLFASKKRVSLLPFYNSVQYLILLVCCALIRLHVRFRSSPQQSPLHSLPLYLTNYYTIRVPWASSIRSFAMLSN